MLQKATRGFLDSRQATSIIAGAWSMSIERAIELHRNGMFMPDVPTSTSRGILTDERLPDGLKYVFGMHRRLMPDATCDSQVATVDEVGYSTRVSNERTKVLEACDMGSRPLHAHHWGPVYIEAAQLMSDDDIAHHIYDNPVDIYVFPWIDTNIRFGLIKPRA